MTRASKAALISGLLFPGAGQIYLKRYRRGLGMITIALSAFIIILVRAVAAAMESISALPPTGVPLAPNDLARLAAVSSQDIWAGSGKVLLALFIGCWALSVVDAYRLGNKEEVKL